MAAQLGLSINANFFGWGVGGADNIAHLCRILSDLGFKKVAALLDGDKTLKAKALATSFPNYFFQVIPAKDIRTKRARDATDEVAGLLDENLTLRPEYRDATAAVLTSLAKHMGG